MLHPRFENATPANFDDLFSRFVVIVGKRSSYTVKKLSRKERKLEAKPWIMKGILTSIWNKCKFYHIFSKR